MGTATVREETIHGHGYASSALQKVTGVAAEHPFDVIASGDESRGTKKVSPSVANTIERAARETRSIGSNASLGASLTRLTRPGSPKRPAAPRVTKHGNVKCSMDGKTFDSQGEMLRYLVLRDQEKSGVISNLRVQVPFVLAPPVRLDGRTKPALRYIADFVYVRKGDSKDTIEDFKGHVTPVYRIKRHLMAVLGYHITEVR